jgi:hypothetical protein
LFGWNKFSGGAMKAINHHFIYSKIRGECISFKSIEDDAVCVWSFLLLLNAGALVLFQITRGRQ